MQARLPRPALPGTGSESALANHKSAVKRIRQSEKRRLRNKTVRTAMRTVVKNCKLSLVGDDVAAASETFRAAEKSLRSAASRGIIPKTRADRTVSRLAKRLDGMSS
jgi:small subunit ribosomal protein S20